MLKLTEWKLQWFEPGDKNPLEIAAPLYIDHFWMTTKVPGDVHSTLVEKKIIEDPFVGHNDLKCRWIEEKEWWYRTTFNWNDKCVDEDYIELLFEGLDTFATVYLNGVEIGSTDNMFIEHSFEVTRELNIGKNTLAIKFDPLFTHIDQKVRDYWCSYGKERIWTRKAAMNFGWDWGPRLVTTGIWKDVSIIKRSKAKINSVFAKTADISSEYADVSVEIEVDKHFQYYDSLSCDIELRTSSISHIERISNIQKSGVVTFKVENPKLWWTHDLGEPHLYDLNITLKDQYHQQIDHYHQKFGIREIKVEQKHENGENLFAFNLNGVRIFAKGANWIPVHNFIGAVEDSRYCKLLQLAKDSHMNMMRVWGGGIYEKDVFYEECDRLGILVWQDFMFANALYPDYNQNFMENVRNEVSKVIKRIRAYTCLAIWCGNNEIDWIYDRKSSDGVEITTPFYGEKIYHELIPQLLYRYDSTRLYWPSSPFGTNDDTDLDSEAVGDTHNWQVWHGNVEPRKKGEPVFQDISLEGVSFKNYKKDKTRFSSEFGMHASSNRYTLSKHIPEGEFYWKSDEMSYRNKDHFHEKGILLMEGFTGIPKNIDEYMNFSMLTQAEGLKYGIEHYRRNKPFTSGALIWQHNDCWPGTSWSMIDYELLPKASFYYAKKFFDPVLATLEHDPGKDLRISIINDQLTTIKDSLIIEVLSLSGEKLFSEEIDYLIDGNAVEELGTFSEKNVLNGADASEVIVRLVSQNQCFQDNVYYLRDYKDITYPKADFNIERKHDDNSITIQATTVARFVKLDIFQSEVQCSDNFFDLLPGESKKVYLWELEGKVINIEKIEVSALNS
ncbi:beta-mannosidase [Metabacillus halosaccharovorans]|uniref:Beta-mannosidase B n=1 Tax=Metabacillus halosaccharovorans TaxID=930124 RepID=A0ABT3DP63_9BACI|nr:glycoside hydrolase family 2 protein [Metabacillus halosaccharovorans]MCV9888683.1 glycoside hydrolase family 2 protein [Metabacillus halosaccharovorans]